MTAMARLDDSDVEAITDEILRQKLSGIAFHNIVTGSGRDQDGDPAIFVRLNMRAGAPIIPGRLLADARVALARALASRGDDRLTYLSVDWPDDETPPSPDVPT
jgi:hypothetical protein